MAYRNFIFASVQRPTILGAVLALSAAVPAAMAEVSHRWVEIPIGYQTSVDVDENGVVDYQTDPHSSAWTLAFMGATWMNGFLCAADSGQVTFLPEGSVVGPAREQDAFSYANLLVVFAIDNWWGTGDYSLPAGHHFIGIQFQRDGAAHYGWLGIVVEGDAPWITATITEIAWESEPDTPIVVGCAPSPDLNGDGMVDGFDLGLLLGAWGAVPPGSAGDLNADGMVDGADLGALLQQWG